MLEQIIKGYDYHFTVVIKSADEIGGYPMTTKKDAAIIEVYNRHADNEDLVDSAWLTISKNGIARLERVQ